MRTAETIVLGNYDAVTAGILSVEGFSRFAREAALWTAEELMAGEREFLGALPLVLKRDSTFLSTRRAA